MRRTFHVSLRHQSAIFVTILLLSALSAAATPDRIAGAITSGRTVALAKSLHPKAQPQNDLGPVDPSRTLSYMSLLMSPSASQQQALNVLLAQQQDPKSPNYHKWLTPQQFADRFGLSQNDLDKVTAWLTSQGFQIKSVGGGRNQVVFSGTIGRAERAFGTQIHTYKVNNEEHFANSTPLMIPSSLKGIVTSVMGLHSFLPKPTIRGRGVGLTRTPRSDYYDGNFIFPNFLAPDDIAIIYDLAALYGATPTAIDGTGQKLAIVGQTDVYLADLNDFRSGFGLSTLNCTADSNGVVTACNDSHFQYVLNDVDPGAVSTCGDLSEADLDIEWSGATARNAQIIYVNSPVTYNNNCTQLTSGVGVNASLTAIINPPSGPPLAPVVSMSYGICEYFAEDLESLLQQGNAEGVTIMNSTGDVGASACDYSPSNNSRPFTPAQNGFAVSYPASSPEVTAVGGTGITLANDSYPTQSSYWNVGNSTANGGSAISYIPEIAWNDDSELALFCHSPEGSFCSTGGGASGWVPLSTSATEAQVQADIWIAMGGGGASNCWYGSNSGVCNGAGPGPSGGGFAQPTYQQGLSVPSAPSGVRYVPDISLLASPDFPGYIFCTATSELENSGTSASSCANGISGALDNGVYLSIVGGTSASTPIFAGIVTLLNQYVIAKGYQNAPGLGNINPNLYYLAAHAPSAFHQVKTGDNIVACQANTPGGQPSNLKCPSGGTLGYQASNADATTGYNLVTGLGSIDANAFFSVWSTSLTPTFTVATPATPASTPAGTNVTWSGTVTAVNGYTGTVTLSCIAGTTAPPSTCTFTPSSVAATLAGTPFTLTVGSSTSGAYNFKIQGTDGTIINTQSVSLTVNQNFTVPATLTDPPAAHPGQSTSTTMLVSPPGSATFTFDVNFACTGLPTGATCSFTPSKIAAGSSATTVTVTVNTAGPFTGAAGSIQHRHSTPTRKLTGQNLPKWLPFTLPMAGIIFFGLAGGRLSRRYRIAGLCMALALAVLLVACGGGGSSSSPPPPATVTPSSAQVQLGGTQQFTASESVTWSLSSGAPGSISSSGLYTAPTSGATPATFTVIGTPTTGSAGSASVTIPKVGVSVSPSTVTTLYPNLSGAPAQTQQFTATVTNDTSNTAVTWSVTGGNSNGTIDANGLYTAPATLPNPASVSVVATSAADTTQSGSATVNLQTPTPTGTFPVTVTSTEGTLSKTTTFTLTVN